MYNSGVKLPTGPTVLPQLTEVNHRPLNHLAMAPDTHGPLRAVWSSGEPQKVRDDESIAGRREGDPQKIVSSTEFWLESGDSGGILFKIREVQQSLAAVRPSELPPKNNLLSPCDIFFGKLSAAYCV